MPEFIKEIYSDTTLTKIEIEEAVLKVYLTLYTEDKLLVNFKNILSVHIENEWNHQEGIEGVEVRTKDVYLDKVLENSKEGEGKFKLFVFIGHPEEVVKIVAEDISISKLQYE